jgi:3-oxoadipate enol-lactonase
MDLKSIADVILERWFAPTFGRRENAAFEGYRNMLIRQPSAGYLATCEAVRNADYTEAARHIRVPTICVVGEEDGSTPPDLVLSLAKLIPNAHYEVIRNAGHLPCVEQPEALTEVITAFLSSVAHGEKIDQ